MSKLDPAVVEESAPRGKGRKNNPEKTRQDILRAAIDEFVAQGLSGARVDAIAERTHTSKRMIYYYFGSKEQLYQAVLEKLYSDIRGIEGTLRLGALPPAKAMEKLVEFSFDYHDRHVDFVRIISIENIHKGEHIASSELVQSVNSSIVQSIAEILRRGEAEGVPRRAGGARRAHADQFVLLLPGVQSLHRVADLSHRPARRRGSPAAPADDRRGGIALHPCLTRSPPLGGRGATQSPRLAKCACMRAASAVTPLNSSNAFTAWNTAMVPPSSVRQPRARAWRSSSVSSGK